MDLVENRLRLMPVVVDPDVRCLYFRKFNSGLEGWGKWTAGDYVALIQQIPYVVGCANKVMDTTVPKQAAFIRACFSVEKIMILQKRDEVDEDDLSVLHDLAKSIGSDIDLTQRGLPVDMELNLDRPKMHSPMHYRYFLALC